MKNIFLLLLPSWSLLLGGCERTKIASQTAVAASPTVVSLVPAATDLMVGMGASNHLVGVSNYDQNPQVNQLLRVGDYLTTDWERIVVLRPQIIITQYAPGRTPSGFEEHLHSIGSRQENLHIDRIEDIFTALTQLGDMCGEKQKAAAARADLQRELQSVRDRASKAVPTRALIVVDETGQNVAGPGTYLDDLLTIAGGQNVMGKDAPAWPAIDRETLMTLSPDVIIQLLPGASTQVQAEAMHGWDGVPNLPAVKNGRIIQLTGSDVLLPGYHVGKLAAQFEEALHPDSAATQPAKTP
jgi:iron complex transport system substrate-binding protein